MATAVIGDEVEYVPSYLFYHNIGIKSVTIGENVQTMGLSVFAYCESLETVYWNAIECECGWTETSALFKNCNNFTTLVIGEGVESIPEYAFYKCSSLESIVIPTSLYYIDTDAFNNCSGITALYYLGTEDDYYISVGSGNESFTKFIYDGDVYLYSEEEPTDPDYDYWHYGENG